MAFTILAEMAKPGEVIYYDPRFRLHIETHLNILINRAAAVDDIPPDKYYQYEGDFHGYLIELGIPMEMHFIYMRMNGMTNPNQFGKEQRDPHADPLAPKLIRPNLNLVDGIVKYFMSRKFK